MTIFEQQSPPDTARRSGPLSGPRPTGGADDGRNPWAFVRSLPVPAAGVEAEAEVSVPPGEQEPDWTEDERLDEVFSAWAAAALTAEVIAERRFLEDEPAPATVGVPASPPPDAEDDAGRFEADVASAWFVDDQPVPPALAGHAPSQVSQDAPSHAPPPRQPWTRGDDDVIPRRRRRRWGR